MPGMKKTMSEFKAGDLHSGSKHGPEVKSRAQAIAIGLSEERKEGHKVPKEKHHKEEMPSAGNAAAPAVISAPTEPHWQATGTAKTHGFGHGVHLRKGALRMSGHPGAHRIGGGRKK